MDTQKIKQKIYALPDAPSVPTYWSTMRAAKENRHGKVTWKKNPIKQVSTPASLKVFRALDKKLRSKMWSSIATEVELNPRKLVTYQPVIAAEVAYHFARHPNKANKEKAYVLGTEKGLCVWNGNHRCVAAMMAGRSFKAIFLDLTGKGI